MTQRLEEAIARLLAVLRTENTALVDQDFSLVGSFVGEKRMALDALNALAASPDAGHAERDDAAAQRLGPELKAVVEENRRLLEQAILVQNRIMAILAGAARQAQMPAGYAARGNRPRLAAAGAVALIVRA